MSDKYTDMKKEAIARGNAHERLEKLIATDTTKMTRDELEEHRAAIRQATADKALGANPNSPPAV